MNDSFQEVTQNQQIGIQFRNQQYPQQSVTHSRAYSRCSNTSNPQTMLNYFHNYQPRAQTFPIQTLHQSPYLKLKKYKQSIYYGQYSDAKRHGLGVMVYNNNRLYEGEWFQDLKHGNGYQVFPNNSVYEGSYIRGKPQGVGRYNWASGEYYEGEWVNGVKNGSGMWRGIRGDSYIGQWKNGKADGYGVHTWTNGDRYEGEFKECLKNGEGIEKFANGDIYKGQYLKGKPNGFGQYYWANGSYFKGNFLNGMRDGHGIWKKGEGNSDKYEGQYKNDRKEGYGIFTWASGNVYKGNYRQDLRNQYGEMYWTDGSYYKGQWKNGIQNGQGQIYIMGEDRKRGIFQNNLLVQIHQQQIVYRSISKQKSNTHNPTYQSNRISGTSLHTQSRASSQKRRSNMRGQRIVIDLSKDQSKHPLLPNRFRRESLRDPIKVEIKKKQRLLHSSFYLHKLLVNKRGNMENGHKSRDQITIEQKTKKRNEIIQQIKSFTKAKVNTMQNKTHAIQNAH